MPKATEYSEKLRDPRWQKRRLEILERDKFTCLECRTSTSPLNIHHLFYKGEPWDTPDYGLRTLCDDCHESACRLKIPRDFDDLDQFFISALVLMDILRRRGFDSGDVLGVACRFSQYSNKDLASFLGGKFTVIGEEPDNV